jgi:hypothetical protein
MEMTKLNGQHEANFGTLRAEAKNIILHLRLRPWPANARKYAQITSALITKMAGFTVRGSSSLSNHE